MPPDLDILLAALRSAAEQRMAQRQQRRAQHAAAKAPSPPVVAKASAPCTVVKAQPTTTSLAELHAQIAEKAAALKALPVPAPISDGERRVQVRARHAEVMQTALDACRAGHLGVGQVAELQALRLRADAALDGQVDVVEELRALRLLDQKQGG